jgi:biopolymer transport protein TolR
MELTSLMDVMFLVLAFFIYSISEMSAHRALKVDLPSARGEKIAGERIIIAISSDDSLQLNGMKLERAELIARVKALASCNLDLPVVISGDVRSSLGVGIELLGKLKESGFTRVSVQVTGRESSDVAD